MTKYKKIETAIKHAKSRLIEKVKKEGLYENFGQEEVRQIQNDYIDLSSYSNAMIQNRQKLQRFDEWCMTYNGRR